jgi:pSer/pThr/pTyr-binding forkhead associated (FHA) protein
MENQNKIAGWLIIHMEDKEKTVYELKEGKNFIGRHTQVNAPDIALHDIFVSRKHAVLVVRTTENYEYEYLIGDNADVQGKPSLNGTFINGSEKSLGNEILKLKDGDTLQAGITKLVLKTAKVAINVDDAVKLVEKMDYKKTIDFEKSGAVLRTTIEKK